jgi:hypothetical protein
MSYQSSSLTVPMKMLQRWVIGFKKIACSQYAGTDSSKKYLFIGTSSHKT